MIEVGLEVGDSIPSHFAQIFRREIGVTPSGILCESEVERERDSSRAGEQGAGLQRPADARLT